MTGAQKKRAEGLRVPRWARRFALLGGLLAGMPAAALEVQVGLGHEGLLRTRNDGFAASLEARTAPLTTFGPIDVLAGGAVEIDDRDDLWAGLGPTLALPFAERWRGLVSVMVGTYAHGDGQDLGSDIEFRTRLAVDRRVADTPWRAGLAVEHKSNAGIGDKNPGVESIFFTIGRSF